MKTGIDLCSASTIRRLKALFVSAAVASQAYVGTTIGSSENSLLLLTSYGWHVDIELVDTDQEHRSKSAPKAFNVVEPPRASPSFITEQLSNCTFDFCLVSICYVGPVAKGNCLATPRSSLIAYRLQRPQRTGLGSLLCTPFGQHHLKPAKPLCILPSINAF